MRFLASKKLRASIGILTEVLSVSVCWVVWKHVHRGWVQMWVPVFCCGCLAGILWGEMDAVCLASLVELLWQLTGFVVGKVAWSWFKAWES